MIYRRLVNTYVWHFSPLCSAWPEKSYEEKQELPASDPLDLCSECTTLLLKRGRNPGIGNRESRFHVHPIPRSSRIRRPLPDVYC